ncbi:MAG: hypoxanthine phosphoribosyltransferase [Chloroflexi bacterium]|nr:MAG: hypoxanthine phosphoribosyltransferase [Chloroflexota bacterium]
MKIDSLTGYGDFARDIQEIIISEDQIQMRVQELGAQISNDYRGKCPVLVGVLKGVLFYMADLLRVITIPSEVDFLAVSSYSSEARTQGVVRLVKDLEIPINHRHVLFVEDVIDTGLTLNYLLRSLREREPESLEVCVLFNKPGRRIIDIPLRYKGFDLPDRFVVGYGLDHQERYRNLPFIGLLKAEAFQNPHHLRECA